MSAGAYDHSKVITITRGREHGEHYLTVKDDGDGIPRDPDGIPDFKYVATHICDSINSIAEWREDPMVSRLGTARWDQELRCPRHRH